MLPAHDERRSVFLFGVVFAFTTCLSSLSQTALSPAFSFAIKGRVYQCAAGLHSTQALSISAALLPVELPGRAPIALRRAALLLCSVVLERSSFALLPQEITPSPAPSPSPSLLCRPDRSESDSNSGPSAHLKTHVFSIRLPKHTGPRSSPALGLRLAFASATLTLLGVGSSVSSAPVLQCSSAPLFKAVPAQCLPRFRPSAAPLPDLLSIASNASFCPVCYQA